MKTSLSLAKIVEQWLENIDVLPITKVSYDTKIKLWFRWLSAHGVDPKTPVRRNLIDYKQNLEQSKRTALTVNAYITVVKLFYKYCAQTGYWQDIGTGIKSSIRYRGHRKSSLTPEDAARLLDSIDTSKLIGCRDKLMLSLMLFMGLRTCEVERININDFDVVGAVNVLRVQRKGRREKAEMLAVPDDLIEMFQNYISDRSFDIDDPLFVTHANHGLQHRLLRTSISKIVKTHLKKIGIVRPDITAHSLRHTCASIMVDQGVDIDKIRDMLGHTTTATTWLYTSEARQRMMIKHSPSLLVRDVIKKLQKQDTHQ